MAEYRQLLLKSEIIQALNKINVNITDEDLNKPSPERVFYIYECIVNYALGVRYSDLTLPNNNNESERNKESQDLIKDSLPIVSFYSLISKVLKNVGIDLFSYVDLINPEPNQFRRNLSAFVQFVRFEQQHTSVIYEFKNKTDEYDNIIKQKNNRIEELKKKIEEVRIAREKDEIEAQKIKESNNELTNQNRLLKSNQDITANNISKLKAQKESLEEKIVIRNLNNSLNDKRQQCANTDKRIQELQASMHKMQALKDIIKESIKSIKECQDNINEFKSFQKKVRDESEKLDKVNNDVANLEMENGQLDQAYKSLEDMEKNMNEKKIYNMQQHDQRMEELKQNYQKVREMYVLKMIDCDKHQKIVQDLDNKTNMLKEQVKSDMSALNSAYNKLKSQVDCYLSEIQVSMKENT
eukprot:jgi/Orpsp1_1/1176623/evm.model.c7180000058352.1